MAAIKGKQLADAPDGISTGKVNDGAITKAKTSTEILAADGTRPLTAAWNVGGFQLQNLAAPSVATDAATKGYVDSTAQGLDVKASVRLLSDANIASLSGTPTIDGVSTVAGDRVLLTAQSTATQNGIWTVAAGAWSRPADFANGSSAAGAFAFVEEGTSYADTGWVCSTNAPNDVVGTDNLSFVQFSSAGSLTPRNGLTLSGSNIDVAPADASLTATPGSLLVNKAPVGEITAVDAGAAAAGTSLNLARGDHKHSVSVAAPVDVGTANAAGSATSLARSDHVHRVPVRSTANKNMTASVTTADNDLATATTVASANALGGYIGVRVNGVHYLVGNGTKVGVDCYISGDGGTTARAFSAVAAGDTLRWNGSVAGFQLATTDRIDLEYDAF